MDQSSLIELPGQASLNEAGRIFRRYLRGGVRMMLTEVMAAEAPSPFADGRIDPTFGPTAQDGASSPLTRRGSPDQAAGSAGGCRHFEFGYPFTASA